MSRLRSSATSRTNRCAPRPYAFVDAEGNNVEEETTCIPFVPHAVDQEYPGLEVEGWEEF